jgi:hypothetical protein
VNGGEDWKCERGYAKRDSACVAVRLPANAHLDYSGSGWECDRGYRQKEDACVLR